MRWTDWTALNHSKTNFHTFDALDGRLSTHASSIISIGGGIEYVTDDGLALRTCVFYEPRAVGSRDLWPNLVDAAYTGFGVGLGYKVGSVQIDFFTGISLLRTTRNSAQPYPGTYDGDNGYGFGIQFTRVWGRSEGSSSRVKGESSSAE
jgi:long-subunit fatty acid transport protein